MVWRGRRTVLTHMRSLPHGLERRQTQFQTSGLFWTPGFSMKPFTSGPRGLNG